METNVPDHLADAWYLSILGVRAEARGRGLDEQLVANTLARADRHGSTCFLETFNPHSLPFYERLGFTERLAFVEEVTARPYWMLYRPAYAHRPD
jgi:ribosomal protein S18 acetylase RimI-like enzyme